MMTVPSAYSGENDMMERRGANDGVLYLVPRIDYGVVFANDFVCFCDIFEGGRYALFIFKIGAFSFLFRFMITQAEP